MYPSGVLGGWGLQLEIWVKAVPWEPFWRGWSQTPVEEMLRWGSRALFLPPWRREIVCGGARTGQRWRSAE